MKTVLMNEDCIQSLLLNEYLYSTCLLLLPACPSLYKKTMLLRKVL